MPGRLFKAIVLGLFVGIVGVLAGGIPYGFNLEEDFGLDFLFNLRGKKPPPQDVVVVSIDKESSERLNLPDNPDKWPRSIHARLIEKLVEAGAKVIAFDVHFVEPRSAEDDRLLAKAIAEARNCVLCEPLQAREIPASSQGTASTDIHSIVKIVKPLALLADSAAATAPFVLPRIPFKVNRYWTFQTGAGDSPTLPVVAFQLFMLDAYDEFLSLLEKAAPVHVSKLPRKGDSFAQNGTAKKWIRMIREIFEADPKIGERMSAELERTKTLSMSANKAGRIRSFIKMYEGNSSRHLNYYGPPRTIPTISYHQVLQGRQETGGIRAETFKDKAVFVGLSEILLAERKDSYYTVFSQANGIFISGVEIAATAFANLLEERPLKPLRFHIFVLMLLLWGTILGVLCRLLPIALSAVSTGVLCLLYLVFAAYRFKVGDTWHPIMIPLLLQVPLAFFGAVVWNYIDVNKERQNIKKALGYHLPKEVVEQIAKDVAHIETESQVVYGICLFTDMERYTALSERLSPAELGHLMNRYYESIFKPVKEQKGYISGVIGDAMLAVWATTSAEASLRKNACMAAVEIKKELDLFNRSSHAPSLRTRIGIHCGQILLGHIGALDHYEYTPIGDIVNTAARIETLNKYVGTGTLVSDEIISQVDGFLCRELGVFKVVGKIKPVRVHELIGYKDDFDDLKRQACEAFNEAREAFKRRSWAEANHKFHQIIDRFGEDGPSRFYIKLCDQYESKPPGESWDGVIRMEKK